MIIDASLGALAGVRQARFRQPTVQVRVGSPQFDNTNHVLSDYMFGARYDAGQTPLATRLEEIAVDGKDYALAGKVSGLLLRNIDSIEAVGGQAAGGGSTRRELEETIRACSSGLTNGGLVEYRKGNLESAIILWDELLGFDPGNAEIKKAVETAKAQLGKLKGSGRGSGRSGRSARGAR